MDRRESSKKKNQPIAIFLPAKDLVKVKLVEFGMHQKEGFGLVLLLREKVACENNSQLYGLAVALALVERIERIGINVNIKWPNDLLVDGQKLAGILPRLLFRGGKLRLLRVGVGLNVFNNVPKEGISLKQIIGNKKDEYKFLVIRSFTRNRKIFRFFR